MAKIRVTKEFTFEMAHALWNYDGACSNIHGHSYELAVTIAGEPIRDTQNPKNGMVVDFGDIKKWVKHSIVDEFDHSLLIYRDADQSSIENTQQMFSRLKIMDFQPTCENLLVYIAEKIKEKLPHNLQLHSLKLRETGTSYAEWYAEDNSS
ncbi:MAG: 6-carboxytetrahydropterin synthase QueD [Bacteroidales bacterium]